MGAGHCPWVGYSVLSRDPPSRHFGWVFVSPYFWPFGLLAFLTLESDYRFYLFKAVNFGWKFLGEYIWIKCHANFVEMLCKKYFFGDGTEKLAKSSDLLQAFSILWCYWQWGTRDTGSCIDGQKWFRIRKKATNVHWLIRGNGDYSLHSSVTRDWRKLAIKCQPDWVYWFALFSISGVISNWFTCNWHLQIINHVDTVKCQSKYAFEIWKHQHWFSKTEEIQNCQYY